MGTRLPGLVFLFLAPFAGAMPVSASSLNLGDLANYAVVDLGSGFTIGQNSGPVTGNELLGNGVTAAFSGGNNGQITGTLYYDNTVKGTNTFSQLSVPPTTVQVPTSVTSAALSTAQSVSSYAASLAATQTFGTINTATTITGTSGLNVINVTNIQNAALTLSGPANATFVFNVSGTLQENQKMTLLGGITAANILFNFLGTSGNVFQTSGGDVLYGTFLATNGGGFNFSNLNLTGELIDTAGNVQLVSGSEVNGTPFSATPVPSALPLFSSGLLVMAVLVWRRKRANGGPLVPRHRDYDSLAVAG
jgi:hypothetical protein